MLTISSIIGIIAIVIFTVLMTLHFVTLKPMDVRLVKIKNDYYFDFKKFWTWHIVTKEEISMYYKHTFKYPFKSEKTATEVMNAIKLNIGKYKRR